MQYIKKYNDVGYLNCCGQLQSLKRGKGGHTAHRVLFKGVICVTFLLKYQKSKPKFQKSVKRRNPFFIYRNPFYKPFPTK